MTTNQEGKHTSFRAISGTTGTYTEDSYAAFLAEGATATTYNGAFIEWLQLRNSSTKTNLNDLQAEYAVNNGFDSWKDVNVFTWTPSQLSSALWLDAGAATTITDSSGAVSQWDDRSGNNNNVTQSTPSFRPTTNLSTIGGKNVLDWGSVSNSKRLDNASTSTSDWRDVYVVCVWDNGSAFPVNVFPGLITGTVADTANVGLAGNGFAGALTRWYSLFRWWDELYVNGATILSPFEAFNTGQDVSSPVFLSFSSTVAVTAAGIVIGSDRDSAARGWRGRIAEVVAFDSKLGTSDRQLMEGYLAWKWGLQGDLPGGHPYENAAPTV